LPDIPVDGFAGAGRFWTDAPSVTVHHNMRRLDIEDFVTAKVFSANGTGKPEVTENLRVESVKSAHVQSW